MFQSLLKKDTMKNYHLLSKEGNDLVFISHQ